jgi:hypothetical protein
MARQALTPGALYKLLNDELCAKRRSACQCRMPLPYLIERPDLLDPVSTPIREEAKR